MKNIIDFECKKCGSNTYKIVESKNGNGINKGLYCAKCGAWHKWLSKNDIVNGEEQTELQENISKIENAIYNKYYLVSWISQNERIHTGCVLEENLELVVKHIRSMMHEIIAISEIGDNIKKFLEKQ